MGVKRDCLVKYERVGCIPDNGGVIRTGMGTGIEQGRPGVSQVSALLLVMYGSRQAIYRIHAVSHPHRVIPLQLRK
jgi:hypothetical protein